MDLLAHRWGIPDAQWMHFHAHVYTHVTYTHHHHHHCCCLIRHVIHPGLREEGEPEQYGSSQTVNLWAKNYSGSPPAVINCCFTPSIFFIAHLVWLQCFTHPCAAHGVKHEIAEVGLFSQRPSLIRAERFKPGCLACWALTLNLSLFTLVQAGTFKRDYVLKNIEGQRLEWSNDKDLPPS